MTDEEGWEFYRRLVVVQLEENRKDIERLKLHVENLEIIKNAQSGATKALVFIVPIVVLLLGWIVNHLMGGK